MKRFLKILRFTACMLVGVVLLVLVTSIGTGIYLIEQIEDESEQAQVYSFTNINEMYAMNSPADYGNDLSRNKSWTILDMYLDNDDKMLVGTWKIDKGFIDRKRVDSKSIDSCDISFIFSSNKSYIAKSNSKKAGCVIPIKNKQYWDITRSSSKKSTLLTQGTPLVISKITATTVLFTLGEVSEKEGAMQVSLVRRK